MVKNPPANAGDLGSIPGGEDPLEKEMASHSSILSGKSLGQRSLVAYSPWGHKESDMTEQVSMQTETYKTKLCVDWLTKIWPEACRNLTLYFF